MGCVGGVRVSLGGWLSTADVYRGGWRRFWGSEAATNCGAREPGVQGYSGDDRRRS
jgi:hypothetical protein